MKVKPNPSTFLSEKGPDQVTMINIEDDSETYLLVHGELAQILKRIFLKKENIETITQEYSASEQEDIQKFINDMIEAGYFLKS